LYFPNLFLGDWLVIHFARTPFTPLSLRGGLSGPGDLGSKVYANRGDSVDPLDRLERQFVNFLAHGLIEK